MEACIAEPLTKTDKLPILTARRLRHALLLTIGVGVAWRVLRYLEQFPIWGDEAMLLLNILERDYAGLTNHLRFAQVGPLIFLWLEKTALLAFGPSEWSVHLFPFLAGLASLGIFWRLCQGACSPLAGGLALAIFAVSYYPVRHSTEVKPYVFDLLAAVIFAWLALEHLRAPQTFRWLTALVLLTPLVVFSSYPSVFVGGAVSLVLLPTMRGASLGHRVLYILFFALLCGCFAVHIGVVGQTGIEPGEAERVRDFLREYWKDAFPPDTWYLWPVWLGKVFTGNMLAYPFGANRGGSVITFLLVVLGSFGLFRSGRRSLLALCWLPFLLNFLAAILRRYPFGESARITLHLAPFICILMAHGIGQIIESVRPPEWRARLEFAVYLALLTCGALGLARDLARPYKTEHDQEVRQLVLDLRRQVGPTDPVYLCHERDEEMLAEFLWYARTQSWRLDWLSTLNDSPRSCWLVMCGNQEPSVADATSRLSGPWRVVGSDVRHVPPENAKMPPMYCRFVHVVRD